jgi:hypothetical protein
MEIRLLIILLLSFATTGCMTGTREADTHAHKHKTEPMLTQHFGDSLFKPTDRGLFSVEMVIKGGKLVAYNVEMTEEQKAARENVIDIIIHDQMGRDVTGATIDVLPWMPESGGGHSTLNPPVITEKGNGLYRLENLFFHHKGYWVIKISIRKDKVRDSATFNFYYIR